MKMDVDNTYYEFISSNRSFKWKADPNIEDLTLQSNTETPTANAHRNNAVKDGYCTVDDGNILDWFQDVK